MLKMSHYSPSTKYGVDTNGNLAATASPLWDDAKATNLSASYQPNPPPNVGLGPFQLFNNGLRHNAVPAATAATAMSLRVPSTCWRNASGSNLTPQRIPDSNWINYPSVSHRPLLSPSQEPQHYAGTYHHSPNGSNFHLDPYNPVWTSQKLGAHEPRQLSPLQRGANYLANGRRFPGYGSNYGNSGACFKGSELAVSQESPRRSTIDTPNENNTDGRLYYQHTSETSASLMGSSLNRQVSSSTASPLDETSANEKSPSQSGSEFGSSELHQKILRIDDRAGSEQSPVVIPTATSEHENLELNNSDMEAAAIMLSIQTVEKQNSNCSSYEENRNSVVSPLRISVETVDDSIQCQSNTVKVEVDETPELQDDPCTMDDDLSRSTLSTHEVPSSPQNVTNESHNFLAEDKAQQHSLTTSQQPPTLYTCNICQYTCAQKFHFNSHMNTHTDRKCTMCDYTSRTEGRLKKHMNEAHLPQPTDPEPMSFNMVDDEADRSAVNAINDGFIKSDPSLLEQYSPPSPDGYLSDSDMVIDESKYQMSEGLKPASGDHHGTHHAPSKPKRYKCKQCQFVAPSKEMFWQHQRAHIKPERLLSCPHCLFVTEYKHHMEYHLRNHSNVKPHKCPKCNYRCVNKSMLNSHLKSHSSIYQYRCLDCSYETKYCHSLKQHLRKHKHRPGKHVNQDGVEEDIQLDIYGNRRGPKLRRNAKPTNNDKDHFAGAREQPPAVIVTQVNSTPASSRNSPNGGHHNGLSSSGLEDNVTNLLACQDGSKNNLVENLYQKMLINGGSNNGSLASVPFLGAGGSMGVQLPTVPGLMAPPASVAMMAAASGDMEKFKQILAAQASFPDYVKYLILQHQQLAAAAASSRSTPNNNDFLLNGGDASGAAGLIFSSTSNSLNPSVFFKEQPCYEQRVRSRSFLGVTSNNVGCSTVANLLKSSNASSVPLTGRNKMPINGSGFQRPLPSGSPLKLPLANSAISNNALSLPEECRSPIGGGGGKASCSSDDGNGSSGSLAHFSSTPIYGNGSSRRKGKAFKLVDTIAMRLQHSSRTPPSTSSDTKYANERHGGVSDEIALKDGQNEAYDIRRLSLSQVDLCSSQQSNEAQAAPTNDIVTSTDHLAYSPSGASNRHNAAPLTLTSPTTTVRASNGPETQQRDQSNSDFSRSYHCAHCGIWFRCQIMYLLHKGYHSNDNPFKCNLCGALSEDALKFFLHISQAAHDEL